MARLILEFNQEVLKDFPVRGRSITIGRHEDNTIVLDNPRVSSYHARIDKTGSDYVLTDLQSTNGTFMNNENVVSRRLQHGDRIRIGEHLLLFVGTEKSKVEAEREIAEQLSKMNDTLKQMSETMKTILKRIEEVKR